LKRFVISLLCYLLFGVLLLGAACNSNAEVVDAHFLNSTGTRSPKLKLDVVRTLHTRNRGMMYRKEMEKEQGMLFVFPDEKPRSFWMKNTYLALDMIFIGSDKKVKSIITRAVPLTETPRPSKEPAQFVVEVLAGKSAEWGITIGSEFVVVGELPNAAE